MAEVAEALPFVTGHNVEIRADSLEFLAVVEIEVQQGVALELPPFGACACAGHAVGVEILIVPGHSRVGGGEFVALVLADLITEVKIEVEFGEEVESVVDLEVTGRRQVFALAVALVEKLHGVDGLVEVERGSADIVCIAVIAGEARVADRGIDCVDGHRRVECQTGRDSVGIGLESVDIRTAGVGVDREFAVEELRSEAEAYGCALHLRTFQDTLIVGVAGADAVGKESGRAAYAEAVVLREGSAESLFLPVGVGVAHVVGNGLVAEFAADELGELSAVHDVEGLAGGVDMPVGGEADARTSACAFAGCDDDHTVRSARTVDGGCRSIFQHGHLLDVLRVDHGQGVCACATALVGLGHTVDNDKRIVGVVDRQRGTAADADLTVACRVTTIEGHGHTGACADQKILGRGSDTGFDVVGLDDGNRTGGVALLDDTVTDGYDFFQHYGIFGELNVDFRAAFDSDILCVIADIRENEGAVGVDIDGVITVYVSGRAVGRALGKHTCTDEGLTGRGSHGTCDRDLLR